MEKYEVRESKERIKKMIKESGYTQKSFAEAFGIPAGTVHNWCQGIAEPAEWVLRLIKRMLDLDDRYYVVENEAYGPRGGKDFLETVIYSGTEKACAEYEDERRKSYGKRYEQGTIDCWTVKATDYVMQQARADGLDEYLESLPPEKRAEVVEIGGKRYRKAVLDFNSMMGL